MKRGRGSVVAISALAMLPASIVLLHAPSGLAQPTAPSGDQQPPSTGTTTQTGPTTTTTTTTTTVPNPYAPPPGAARNTGPIGGGNATESSARTVTGTEEDTFDLGHQGTGPSTLHGDKNGPIFSGRVSTEVPFQHVVRRGDTLSGICDAYFHNPYQWPRVWSYNPQIQNPHWIYPGDLIRLRVGGASAYGTLTGNGTGSTGGIFGERRRQIPIGTVIQQEQGFIDEGYGEDWGEVTGSPLDKMFLTEGDEIYLHVAGTRDVRIGQELTIFRPVRAIPQGQVVQIQGTVRVNQWNGKERVARGVLTDSLDVIERGARVGPVGRRFEVVPPVRNDADVSANVIASVHPNNFFGQNQLVFVDKGKLDGLKVGNRLFIMRRGDAWRRSLVAHGPAEYRISPENENLPDMERVPGSRDDQRYPNQLVGELRVVKIHDHTATCLVSEAKLEIERGDAAVARKGY